MRAIRVREFGSPDVLKTEEFTLGALGPGQAKVQLEAIGVNPVETYIRSGSYGTLPDLPYTPGSDGAGVIVEVGPDYNGPAIGERVYLSGSVSGTYATEAICEARTLHTLPSEVSFAQGAALGIPYATAYQALFHKGGAQPGQRALIHGASGGVGLACIQLARAAGLSVVGTAGTDEGRELILDQGGDVALPHGESSFAGPYDLIVEMLANNNLDRDLEMLKPRGTVVVVGNRGPTQIDARKAMAGDLTIRGMVLFNANTEEYKRIHAALGAGLRNGTLSPVVRDELKLERFSRVLSC